MAEQRYSNLSESGGKQISDYDEVKHEGLFDGGDTTVILTSDDGKLPECVVLTIFEAGGKEYVVLMPGGDEDEDGDIFLYRYAETEDGQPDLTNIESDGEHETMNDAFDEILDEEEFKELMEGGEDDESKD